MNTVPIARIAELRRIEDMARAERQAIEHDLLVEYAAQQRAERAERILRKDEDEAAMERAATKPCPSLCVECEDLGCPEWHKAQARVAGIKGVDY